MDSNSREISNHINGGSDESTQNKAQRYLQQHNLEPLLAEMLNTLVYEKVKKPEIFMIKYLSGVLSEEEKISHGIHITKGQSAFPSSKPIVSYPSQSNNEVLKRNLTKDLWNNLKYNKSKYGANIMDILKDEKAGLTLVDSDCLNTFRDLFVHYINDIHGINAPYRAIDMVNSDSEIESVNDQYYSKFLFTHLHFAKFEYSRNLVGFPFPRESKDKSHVLQAEEIIRKVLFALEKIDSDYKIQCTRYLENSDHFMKIIMENRITLHSSKLDNLAIFTITSEVSHPAGINTYVLVNDYSHVRLITTTADYSKLFHTYERLNSLHKELINLGVEKLHFEYDTHFGFLNSDIENLGNALDFTGETMMESLHGNVSEFEEVKRFVNGHNVLGKPAGIQTQLKQRLKQTENEFLVNLFQQLYSLDYIETHHEKPGIEDISTKIEEASGIATPEIKYYQSLQKAYQSAYPIHKYSHFYSPVPIVPSEEPPANKNINLNTVLEHALNNQTNTTYFQLFPIFYHTFLMTYRNIYDEIIYRKSSFLANRNIDDFRDSLVNLEAAAYDLSRIRKFDIVIRRNLRGYNFAHFLTSDERKVISDLISEHLDSEVILNSDGQIAVKINEGDHLRFQLHVESQEDNSENISNLLTTLQTFFKLYKDLTSKLEYNKVIYNSDDYLGFLTNELKHLGSGLNLEVDISNPEKTEFTISPILEKEGFWFNNDEDGAHFGCNMNINIGIYRIFNVMSDLLKTLKFDRK